MLGVVIIAACLFLTGLFWMQGAWNYSENVTLRAVARAYGCTFQKIPTEADIFDGLPMFERDDGTVAKYEAMRSRGSLRLEIRPIKNRDPRIVSFDFVHHWRTLIASGKFESQIEVRTSDCSEWERGRFREIVANSKPLRQ